MLALFLGGCASTATPAAGQAETPPAETPVPQSVAPDSLPAPDEIDSPAGTPELDFDSLVAGIRSEASLEREASILPFGITWSPVDVVEGSALAFQVLQPRGGREPVALEGTLAGHAVRFARIGSSWLGMAAVPIGVNGIVELELEVRFEGGSEHRQSVSIEIASRAWDQTTMRVAPQYSSPPQEVRDRIARERRLIRSVLDSASTKWLFEGAFESPRPYDITSPFGQERVFNGELQSRHTGLDLRGTVGEPVYAAGRGRIALAGDFYYSGNGIFLDHGRGVYTGYFHLSEILVGEGQLVDKGDLIGRVGATGRVTGPHLHWSLWVDGTGQDAASLLAMEIPSP
jgi:murein DD-endopeptidase MepM/ murein hydrolase activator NlpD